MGTSKKLMLASLVSMMVVLAFGIGLVPSHDAARTSAAGGSGRLDFGQFLDMILLNEGGAPVTRNCLCARGPDIAQTAQSLGITARVKNAIDGPNASLSSQAMTGVFCDVGLHE